jgi:D-glycero-alpha-D-manno-heptose-7-phosphate kinase
MMLYTGTSRLSSEVAGDIIENLPKKKSVLHKMHAMVDQALNILNGNDDLEKFGRLLNQTWELKSSLSNRISNSNIDRIYETARANGALGGKLLGAGASGFMLFFAAPEKQQQIKDALPGYLHVPFKFENEGSTIIYYSERDSAEYKKPIQDQS